MMVVGDAFREALDVLKRNMTLVLPAVFGALITNIFFLLMVSSLKSPKGTSLGIVLMLFNILIYALVQGMTISMASDALRRGSCSMGESLHLVIQRLWALLAAAGISAILTAIGFSLFVLPGFLVMFFLMYTFVILIVEEAGPVDSLKKSLTTVWGSMKESALGFGGLFFFGLVAFAIRRALLGMPLVGQIAAIFVNGLFMAYSSLVLLGLYNRIRRAGQ